MTELVIKWIKYVYASILLSISDKMLIIVAKLLKKAVNARQLNTTDEVEFNAFYRTFEQNYNEIGHSEILETLQEINRRTHKLLTEGRVGMIKRSDIPSNQPNHSSLVEEVSYMITHLENLIRGKKDTTDDYEKIKIPTLEELGLLLQDAVKNTDMTDTEKKEIDDLLNKDKIEVLTENKVSKKSKIKTKKTTKKLAKSAIKKANKSKRK